MAGVLPAEAQASEGPPDALAGGAEAVNILQVALQQRGSPDRGAVAPVARVLVHDRIDEGVDDPQGRRRATAARRVEQAVRQVEVAAVLEAAEPMVDGLPADQEEAGDLGSGPALMEPQQGLGTA